MSVNQRETLAHYRDRCIETLDDLRGIGCVVDECDECFEHSTYSIPEDIANAVDALVGVLIVINSVLKKADDH